MRDSSRVFQAAKQLQAAAAPPADMGPSNPLYLLERAVGVTQHHDAVSGTSKQHVANDYARRLAGGRIAADQLVTSAFATLTGYEDAVFVVCDLANVTICPVLEAGTPYVLAIYNQWSAPRPVHVRVPVGLPSGLKSFAVFNSSGGAVPAQMAPLSAGDSALRTYYSYSSAVPASWLAFTAPDVPALGFHAYFLQPSASREGAPLTAHSAPAPRKRSAVRAADTTLSNGLVSLTFSAATGRLTTYQHAADGVNVPFTNDACTLNNSPPIAHLHRQPTLTLAPILHSSGGGTVLRATLRTTARAITASAAAPTSSGPTTRATHVPPPAGKIRPPPTTTTPLTLALFYS